MQQLKELQFKTGKKIQPSTEFKPMTFLCNRSCVQISSRPDIFLVSNCSSFICCITAVISFSLIRFTLSNICFCVLFYRKAPQRWYLHITLRIQHLKTILNNTRSEDQEAYCFSTAWTRNKSTRQDGRLL